MAKQARDKTVKIKRRSSKKSVFEQKTIITIFNQLTKNPILQFPKNYEGQAVFSTLPFDRFDCPKFKPEKWQLNIKKNNNCYNYALDLPFKYDSTLHPGELAMSLGKVKRSAVHKWSWLFTRDDYKKHLIKLSELDGLKYLGTNQFYASQGARLVGLAVSETHDDFHWYRMDQDGGWSHKPGSNSVQKLAPDAPITLMFRQNILTMMTPPHVADRGRYKHFVGYFEIPKEGVKYDKKRLRKQLF